MRSRRQHRGEEGHWDALAPSWATSGDVQLSGGRSADQHATGRDPLRSISTCESMLWNCTTPPK